MLYLTFGLVIVEDNCFVHVCEKFKENLYVKAVNLISWTWKLPYVQRFCLFIKLIIIKRVVVAISYSFQNKLLGFNIHPEYRSYATENRDTHGVSLNSATAIVLRRIRCKILDLAPMLPCDCGSRTFFHYELLKLSLVKVEKLENYC